MDKACKKLKKKVIKMVSIAFRDEDISIIFAMTPEMQYNTNIMGLFYPTTNKIAINPMVFLLSKKQREKVVLHEIGHYIHKKYFNFSAQYLPRKKRGDSSLYCNSSQMESFAECFADYIYAFNDNKFEKIEKSKRLSKMERLLKSV